MDFLLDPPVVIDKGDIDPLLVPAADVDVHEGWEFPCNTTASRGISTESIQWGHKCKQLERSFLCNPHIAHNSILTENIGLKDLNKLLLHFCAILFPL